MVSGLFCSLGDLLRVVFVSKVYVTDGSRDVQVRGDSLLSNL